MTAPLHLKDYLEHKARRYWVNLLMQCQGNVRRAAIIAGVNRTSAYKMIAQLNIMLPPNPRQHQGNWRHADAPLHGQ